MDLEIVSWIDNELRGVSGTPLFKKYFEDVEELKEENTLYLLNSDEGIGVTMPLNLIISTIQLYSEGKDGCRMFKGELPFNLQFSYSRDEVRSRLGMPKKSGGGKTVLYIGYTPYWDKYFLDGCTLHFQYSNDDNSIQLITIGSLGLEEYFNSSLQ